MEVKVSWHFGRWVFSLSGGERNHFHLAQSQKGCEAGADLKHCCVQTLGILAFTHSHTGFCCLFKLSRFRIVHFWYLKRPASSERKAKNKEFYCFQFNLYWYENGLRLSPGNCTVTKCISYSRVRVVWLACLSCTISGHMVHFPQSSALLHSESPMCEFTQRKIFITYSQRGSSSQQLREKKQFAYQEMTYKSRSSAGRAFERNYTRPLAWCKTNSVVWVRPKRQNTPSKAHWDLTPFFIPLNWSNPQLIACQAVLAWNRIYDETKSGGKRGWRLRERGKMGWWGWGSAVSVSSW